MARSRQIRSLITHVFDRQKAVNLCHQLEYQSHCDGINKCVSSMYVNLLGQRPDELQDICVATRRLDLFLCDLRLRFRRPKQNVETDSARIQRLGGNSLAYRETHSSTWY